MRSIILFLAIAGIGIISWLIISRPKKIETTNKQQAIAVSKHSDLFNNQVEVAMNEYYKIAEYFVNWDSTGTSVATGSLIKALDSTGLDELNKDSAIYLTAQTFIDNAKADAETILKENRIRHQREAFNSLTDNLYQFLNTVKYDKGKLYLQECPMAFDDTKPGLWLSKQEEIRNPYLGLKDPQYGKGMLKCGETKVTMNHTGVQ
jgi:hypothetical protein